MIELRINGALVDVGADIGVRLNRKLIDPTQLNTVDAQYSYAITLPPTATNNAVLGYPNVEETRNKFNREYAAELTANSVQIFTGLFRLTNISAKGYPGNLYLPKLPTVKDIFGTLNLNQNPEWRISFSDFVTDVNTYNNAAATSPQPAIFPYVLYGLLPKVPTNLTLGSYTARDLWDDTVRTGITDFAPSVNVLLMLKQIFAGAGYTIAGTAFNDRRLKELYISYRNADDYVQPWNYGKYAHIHVTGRWSNDHILGASGSPAGFEKGVLTERTGDYVVDLLNATNTAVDSVADPGGNVIYSEVPDAAGNIFRNAQIRIPVAGYYKVSFNGGINSSVDNTITPAYDNDTDTMYISGKSDLTADMTNTPFELRLCRDYGKGDFGLQGTTLGGQFYAANQPQNQTFDANNTPKYFPQVSADGQINFVDKLQDPNIVVGMMFGKQDVYGYTNPQDTASEWAQIYAAKPALSYDGGANDLPLTKLAINSPGFWRWGPDSASGALGYAVSNKYAIELDNAPANYARRGEYGGATGLDTWHTGQGSANAVVWFEANELLTVAAVTFPGQWKKTFYAPVTGYVRQNVLFDLEITPFRTDNAWLKVNNAGQGLAPMDWDDPTNFDVDSINLMGFLDADTKTDDFINQFCSAFNLALVQLNSRTFALNVKQAKTAVSNLFVNLDNMASVDDRVNEPLGLPSEYVLGFTIDQDEEGYIETGEDGGGEYATGATEVNVVTQTSSFSYSWYKNITKTESTGDITIALPIISKGDVWDPAVNYPDGMKTRYTDLAQRFWYFGGILPGTYMYNGAALNVAAVRNDIPGLSVLTYRNQPFTILQNFFTLLINGASCFTEIAGYLTAVQYNQLDGSLSVMFNGDQYLIAEVSPYDPEGTTQSQIKLIRKI